MQSSGPFAIALTTPGTTTAVTAPASAGIQFDAVILSNHSPLACQVNIGGPAKWLQPWSSDLYPLPPGDSVNVTPAFSDASGTTTGSVTADWYSTAESPVGTYPVSLFSEAITAAITGSVQLANFIIGSFTFTASSGSADLQIPANTHTIKIFVTITSGAGTGNYIEGTVQGDQSGFLYASSATIASGIEGTMFLSWPGSGMDTSATFSITPGEGSLGGTVYVMGSSDPSDIPVTIENDPLLTSSYHSPDQYASSTVGSGSNATLVTGGTGVTVRIFSAWITAGLTTAPANTVGAAIKRASNGDMYAAVQLGASVTAGSESTTFGANGLAVPLGAGDTIELQSDVAPIIVKGGIAYTFF